MSSHVMFKTVGEESLWVSTYHAALGGGICRPEAIAAADGALMACRARRGPEFQADARDRLDEQYAGG